MSTEDKEVLRDIFLRALNRNQILILKKVDENHGSTITSLLLSMEEELRIPLSTLKLNAKILRKLKLISFGNSSPAVLSEMGRVILEVIEDGR